MATTFTFGPVKVLARKDKAVQIEYRGDRVWLAWSSMSPNARKLLRANDLVPELTLPDSLALEKGFK